MKVGDVVQLKSGGPKMTVDYVHSGMSAVPKAVNVVWFDEGNRIQTASFDRNTLKVVNK